MPYNQMLAERLRSVLKAYPPMVEKKMFGGIGFMINGNMACGLQGDDLLVRVGAENDATALTQPHVRPFMPMPGKPSVGWVLVAPEGTSTDQDLERWVNLGYKYASSLPEKK
jgi:TfoX/Sxy family transcriptional regulator of competence genes